MNRVRLLAAAAASFVAAPALASQPLLFQWSGTDSSNNPFSVAFTITDAQNGDNTYDFNDFGTSVFVDTETVGQTQIVTDVTSDTLGGTFAYPTSTNSDPYFYISAAPIAGGPGTFLQTYAAADDSNIGLTFNGNVIETLDVNGVPAFAFGDPSTAGSLSDLFPVGTYAVTSGDGLIEWNNQSDNEFLTPDTLTISVIPAPTTAALLTVGGVALVRRQRTRTSMGQ